MEHQKGPQIFQIQIFLDPKLFWTQKFLWTQIVFVTQNILVPKFFWTPDFMDQKFYWFMIISDPKLNTFTWELSVALLSPTCYPTLSICLRLEESPGTTLPYPEEDGNTEDPDSRKLLANNNNNT